MNTSKIKFRGNTVHTNGFMPAKGTIAPDFTGVRNDLSDISLYSFKGKKIILNIFPSLDTPVCATSVRHFNKEAATLKNAVVLAISKDLPFAQGRFCTTEGIGSVIALSVFRDSLFEDSYGMLLVDGPLKGLLTRGVIVIDEFMKIIYTELVPEVTVEPNYEAALASLT
ncbi:MAG: thiol peroxidase [Tannerellaceae bacterium]|jgi:thiol peroxidase|nr:thiol peroxidase [Tannerellaceae bacterium]